MHHVAHRLGEDKEESRQPNAGKHQEQQVDTSKITPTLRKSLSLLRQTFWKPFRKSAMELDLLPWTGTAPSASSCLAQDALRDRGGKMPRIFIFNLRLALVVPAIDIGHLVYDMLFD